MVDLTVRWQYRASHSLTQYYGNVELLPGRVLGQWFCLERSTGQLLWHQNFTAPNTVFAVRDDVIIASETRSDGPRTANFGIYGISLINGKVIWRDGDKDFLGNLFGLNLLGETAVEVRDNGEVVTQSGRVLDLKTGNNIRKEKTRADRDILPINPGEKLYGLKAVDCGRGKILKLGTPGQPENKDSWNFSTNLCLFQEDKGGEIVWEFQLEKRGYFIEGNYFSYRYRPPFVWAIASDKPLYIPDPQHPKYLVFNQEPKAYFILVLDTNSGEIVKTVPLGGGEVFNSCRLESIDDSNILVSGTNYQNTLLCFDI